jgi:hypothetical protein
VIAVVAAVALLAISAALSYIIWRRNHQASLSSKGTTDEGPPPETLVATVDTTYGSITGIIDGRGPREPLLYASLFEDTLTDDDGRAIP